MQKSKDSPQLDIFSHNKRIHIDKFLIDGFNGRLARFINNLFDITFSNTCSTINMFV